VGISVTEWEREREEWVKNPLYRKIDRDTVTYK
jgi:hypothetical protein